MVEDCMKLAQDMVVGRRGRRKGDDGSQRRLVGDDTDGGHMGTGVDEAMLRAVDDEVEVLKKVDAEKRVLCVSHHKDPRKIAAQPDIEGEGPTTESLNRSVIGGGKGKIA